MTRLAYRLYRFASSVRFWALRRFTRAGWLMLVALVLCGGMATDTEQSLGYQAFTLVAALLVISLLGALRFRARFEVERSLPRFATVGEPIAYRVVVRNLTPRLQSDLSIFDGVADAGPTFAEFAAATRATNRRKSFRVSASAPLVRRAIVRPAVLPALPARGAVETELRLLPAKRGVLRFTHVSLARPDPFGLFRSLVTVRAPGAITVLPRRYAVAPMTLPGGARYQQGGVAFASSVGESEEFVALRDYRAGDPLRHIHWRSWARMGRPIVKEFQDEFFVRHALILDTFAGPDGAERFEEAVSVAASFACTIDTQESLLDLLFVGPEAFCFTIGRGVAHADQMLEILASVKLCAEKRFAVLEKSVVEHAAEVSGVICIFLDWDEPRQELVRKLKAMGVPVLVLVVRAAAAPPLEFGVLSEAPEALHALEMGNIGPALASL